MDKIQLIYVENVIRARKKGDQQELSFLMAVENTGYDKKIDVIWSGEDEVWHTLPVKYHGTLDQTREYWQVRAKFHVTLHHGLPGNIQFALRYQTQGQEYWDNNQGRNYSSPADSGIQLMGGLPVQNIGFDSRLKAGQKIVPVTVAVDSSVPVGKVVIHWTTDNWQQVHKTRCYLQNRAAKTHQNGVRIWKGRVKANDAYRVQYSICCESKGQLFWDNNYGNNYSAGRDPLKVLILNLHCYQEDRQDYKFSQIAKAINQLGADIVCFQEVAENWNHGAGDWGSNSARIINERIRKPYHIYADWSHLGFDRYREGVAILSRYPLANSESRYVSDSDDVYSIHSRKVVMSQVHVPYIGLINVFSAHLSWMEDGFHEQFERLCEWANTRNCESVRATLLCGDFNIAAGSTGYHQVVDGNEYEDQYLAANEQGLFEKIFRVNDPHWRDYLADDYRIDYIFMNKTSDLCVTSARVLFTDQDYGRVSDHCGYLMTFEPQ